MFDKRLPGLQLKCQYSNGFGVAEFAFYPGEIYCPESVVDVHKEKHYPGLRKCDQAGKSIHMIISPT